MAGGSKLGELDGGHADSHPEADLHPLLVAPTTKAEKNTFRMAFAPVACWRLDDLRFEFDSSFVLPETEDELKALAELRKKHEGATLSIFGHADPVGNDDYNKGLSGRRAEAVYALLIRDTARWEKLYSTPHGGDNWAQKDITPTMLKALGYPPSPTATDALHKFQADNGLPASNSANKATREKLFEKYMDFLCGPDLKLDKSTDFLGRGADSGGKADYQGCSEFNPLLLFSKAERDELEKPVNHTKRNAENAPNRRVVAYLFRKQAKVTPSDWPCPRASEGTAGCRKRFWSDSTARLQNTAKRRTAKDDGDTFGCRFYDRLTLSSPCERPVEQPPLTVYLQIGWLDPDKKEHPFPKDTKITILYADGSKDERTLLEDGVLEFGAVRRKKSFVVVLEQEDEKRYMAVAPPDDADTKDAIVDESKVKDLVDKGHRVFLLPKTITQKIADWLADGTAKREFDNLNDPAVTTIGTEDTPVKLFLNPNWQYLRFEYFDRYFGHTDHDHKRISLPGAVIVEGFRKDPGGRGKKDKPDTRSNWIAAVADPAAACHALPWILQRTDDGKTLKDDPKPDAKILLQFTTEKDSYVVAKTKDERKVEVVTDKKKLAPSADRLKYYDLPALWKSTKWFTRQGAAGVFFDKLTDAQAKASLVPATKLVFSLDDIVLTNDQKKQITMAATDRVAVFFHRFVSAAEAGKTSPLGVYKQDDTPGAVKTYFSDASVATKAYVTDYPNWTRLVVAQGNLFEAFAERTIDDAANDVVGARAAVRWVDSVAVGTAAGNALSPRPARVDKDFASVSPFFEQIFNRTTSKYTGPGTTTQTIGRYDMALFRCCDHDGDVEVTAAFHYFRMLFSFNPAPAPAPAVTPPSNFHPPNANFQANRDQYQTDCCANMAARWNGNDAVNATRSEFLAHKDDDKIKGQVVVFVQPATAAANAHFNLQIVRPGAGALGGRAWMQGLNGTGELGENSQQPENTFFAGSYVAAHELGHGDSLPDEYNERWNAFSANELSFQNNLPGDPFEKDGANWNNSPAVTSADTGIMNGVEQVRNRYLWHSAEFARVVTKKPFKAKYTNGYPNYRLPPHPNAPNRTYAYWPAGEKIDEAAGARGKHDIILYAMGEDRFAKDLIPNGPFEGTIIFNVKMVFTFSAVFVPMIAAVLSGLRTQVDADHNDKFYATGKIQLGTPAEEWEFKRCKIRFSPRFICSNLPSTPQQTADYNALVANVGTHFNVAVNQVVAPAAPNSRWAGAAPGNNLILEADAASPTVVQTLRASFRGFFAQMLGFATAAAVSEAGLKPYIQKVITTAGDVKHF